MNLAHVRTFVEVVEAGNLNKAAERLNVTQSTVTARIDALEQTVGQKLLRRNRSGTEVTAAGTRFLRHARALLQIWNQARYDTSLPKGFDDICTFGCTDALWTAAGQLLVDMLREQHARLAISAVGGQEGDVNRGLANGIIDVAILYEPVACGDCSLEPLFEDAFLLVATTQRVLQRWDPLYVYVDLGDDFRRKHVEAYPVDETAVVSFSHSEHALHHLLKWGGSAYLPYRSARSHMADGRLFEVKDAPRFSRTAYLAVNRKRTETWPAFTDFLDRYGDKLRAVTAPG